MSASTDLIYYVGQGNLSIAPRITAGAVNGGFRYVGDLLGVQIGLNEKFADVFENNTGYGFQALHAPVQIEASIKLILAQWSTPNLQLALWGSTPGASAGGTVTGESVNGYVGLTNYLANIGATNLTLTVATGAVTSVTVAGTPTGYSTTDTVTFSAAPSGGVTATGVIASAAGGVPIIQITNPGSGYLSAPTVTVSGGSGGTFTAVLGGTLVSGTDFTTNGSYGAFTILATSPVLKNVAPTAAIPLVANYTYEATNGRVDAYNASPTEWSVKIEAKNVANPFVDSNNSAFAAVLIEAYRAFFDPSKMLDLIGKKDAPLELDGVLLVDPTRAFTPGSGRSVLFSITKA